MDSGVIKDRHTQTVESTTKWLLYKLLFLALTRLISFVVLASDDDQKSKSSTRFYNFYADARKLSGSNEFNDTHHYVYEQTSALLTQRDRATAVCCAYARVRFPICHNWIFCSLSAEMLYAQICRSRRFSKGWVTLRLNLWTIIYGQYLWTIRYGNGCTCTTTLPLEVFTQRNFVADFIQLKFTFFQKNEKPAF